MLTRLFRKASGRSVGARVELLEYRGGSDGRVCFMRRRIGALLSVAALAAVGVAASPASADPPTCPPGTGFTAAISHPGYPTSASHGGQQNPAFENAFHAPGCP